MVIFGQWKYFPPVLFSEPALLLFEVKLRPFEMERQRNDFTSIQGSCFCVILDVHGFGCAG